MALPSLTLTLTTSAFATVGGGQTLEILGYEPKDQKVYILRDYEDERGRTPQLYYYDLNAKDPAQLIEVKSIYINPLTNSVDHDQRWDEVTKSIDAIKQRLKPLHNVHSTHLHLKSSYYISSVPAWHDHSETMRQYHYEYTIVADNLSSKSQQAISYKAGISLKQAYKIPDHDKLIVTVEYLAFPEETGYTNEDVVMLQAH